MTQRLHIVIRGAVQGVGFRPFIYRLATAMELPGWVSNSPQGVFVEVEGLKSTLDQFLLRIEKEKPPLASIQSLEFSFLDPIGFTQFQIRQSDATGELSTLVLPDIATCSDCLTEIFDPANRRYLYPFTNCTHCGPRFTIIELLPYDRPHTSMKFFAMCEECLQEYKDPLDRRFHAQPNACPLCGPQLELWDFSGSVVGSRHEALLGAAKVIREGQIVAIKGIGGFQLFVDSRNEKSVCRLRRRKHRDEKPLALMFPNMESVRAVCSIPELEARLLNSPESPIVLLQRNKGSSSVLIAPSVAPNNPYLGVMLPYSPLHHILLRELGFPVVATSGNLSDEPICIDQNDALQRLHGIADFFLVHNRPILRHADDSVVRVIRGRELVLRRARGYAPLPISLRRSVPRRLLAVGAHLKNSIAMTSGGRNVFISQHIGNLENNESFSAFRQVIKDLESIYKINPNQILCDFHPDYLSTHYARGSGLPLLEIQHHYAHVAACMAENELEGSVLGVAWDGAGWGPDGTLWGGEFLLTEDRCFRHFATFRPFPLPGGTRAIKEPRRTALGLLFEMSGGNCDEYSQLPTLKSLNLAELSLLQQMMAKGVNSPRTSSVGRLFDALASLTGLRQTIRFEGQAAMELEFAINEEKISEAYPFRLISGERTAPSTTAKNAIATQNPSAPMMLDWEPMILAIQRDLGHIPVSRIAAQFHNTLAEMVVEIARRCGEERVVLTGGCFQNRYLTERTADLLEQNGFRPYWHQRIPPNDGGIALGQIAAASRLYATEE